MKSTFENKVIIITGATSGIGRATALAFAREGAKVVLAGRRESEGNAVVEEIQSTGGTGIFVRTDVSQEEDSKRLVEKAVSEFGRLDFAFNNAGVFRDVGPITGITDEVYEQTFDINVRGVVYGLKYQIPAILKSGGGAIVNNASVLGLTTIPGAAIYNASKFAVVGLTKTAALEFSGQGVRINAVCPGVIETEINEGMRGDPQMDGFMKARHPIGRYGTVDEIAAAVIFLCSPGASFTTGIALPVDGGWSAQ